MAEDMSSQAKPAEPLRTKSYFAPSIQAAIAIARAELGEDLLLVSSQSTVGQDRQFGDFQVVFASGDETLSPPVEESALKDSLPVAPHSFQDVLSAMLPAATTPARTKEEKLTHIHLCLADLSISLSDSERVMDLIKECLPGSSTERAASLGEVMVPQSGTRITENFEADPLPQTLGVNSALLDATQEPMTTARLGRTRVSNAPSSPVIAGLSLTLLLLVGAAGIYGAWKRWQ
jgi:hypothetical protein